MLAQDNSGATKYLWVATATQGVQRRDNGSWITSTALAGKSLRCIASDPNNPDILYAAVSDDGNSSTSGVYRSTNARGAMTFTKMADYPPTVASSTIQYVEELFALDDAGTTRLYTASNHSGIFRYSGGTWTDLNNGIDTGTASSTPKWVSITGYKSGANIILYAGAVQGVQDNTVPKRRKGIMRSTDGGANWTAISIAGNSTVDYTVYGTSVLSWFRNETYQNFAQTLQWCAAHLVVDPDRTDQLVVAGRGGVWMGTFTSTWTWQPAHNGLMVTVNKTVATDPLVAGRLAWSNGDHVCLTSTDHGTTVLQHPADFPAGESDIKGDVAVYDPQDATLFLNTSPRNNNNNIGAIASNTNPYAGGTWVDENLPVYNDAPGLAVGRDSGGNRVILVTIAGSGGNAVGGLWRKTGSTWTQITGGPFSATNINNASFSWYGSRVYAQGDSGTGLWRSNNAGLTWVKIHAANAEYATWDTVCADKINQAYVYVRNTDGSFYRITNGDTTTGTGTTVDEALLTSVSVGSLAMSPEGWLFVHDFSGKLWRCLDPRAAVPVFDVVSDAFYTAACSSTRTLAVGLDGYVYTGDSGRGATVGSPIY
ncbi:hypothetical protein IPL68_01980 [Candidatus Saccharibacteria bacterium]|nr:MAG: hypothetical protein IPL68_01980 [Candidatus Saccharibacteria bacterium]